VPSLLVWGRRDPIIPVAHGEAAHAAMPGSRLEVFDNSGHFPHMDDPLRFVNVMRSFLQGSAPGRLDPSSLRATILSGGAAAA
jgi:pimeloyl-ACP methyl ester carboxylesterase